jgi:hypothetical protein
VTDDRPSRRVVTTKPPIDLNFPRGPETVPKNPGDDIEPAGGERIDLSGWQPSIPALLVPIRVETKYVDDELRIRILPDRMSVQGAAPASAGELEEAVDFWVRYHAAKTAELRTATWRQYARRLGSTRAGFVARLTRPTVDAKGQLNFPRIVPETDGPAFATLLPERWMATGWVGDKVAFQEFSDPVTGPLAVSPDPTAPTTTLGGSGLQIDPATAWLFDYQEALERGMAITVPLTGTAAIAADGVTTLVVIGVNEAQRPLNAAAELQALFEQHSQSAGLAFVPQGTPTNNTETVASGYRRVEAELADLEERELGAYEPHTDDNATRLAGALGLSGVELFGRLAHGSDRQHQIARDMRIALFETVFGTFARELLATHDTDGSVLGDGFGDEAIDAVRSWFVTWLTGGAPVPTLRVGDQPYGILPVMSRANVVNSTEPKQHISSVIDVLIEEWRHALTSVAVLDHNATDALQDDDALADAEARELVTAVLANNPHPRRLAVRSAKDWSDQPRPVQEFPGGEAGPAAFGPEDSIPGGDPTPALFTGGFRWEYDNAIDTMNTDWDENVKKLYEAVIQEVVPNRPDLDEVPTGPIGGAAVRRRAASVELEQDTRPSTEEDIRGIEQQIEVWVRTDAAIDDPFVPIAFESFESIEESHEFVGDMIERLEAHELRQRPLRWLDVPGLDGVLGRDDLQLLLTSYSAGERLWQRATVQDDEPPAGITSAVYLADLSERAWADSARTGPIVGGPSDPRDDLEIPGGQFPRVPQLPAEFLATAPLLYQLIDATLAEDGHRQELSEALARLAAVDPTELDWMLRETLGLGSHRLDAWHTSFATERLSAMRTKAPAGVYVGSYGFVLDLDRSEDRPSHGFIHAPSLPHAASAAVLRSGWISRGNNDNESPAAIDLASGRVRQADWILSGVRHGQDLGDLLGAEFERSLHDARLDVAIRPLRAAVAAADGLGDSALDVPVDGVRLLDLHRAGELDATVDGLALETVDEDRLVDLFGALESTFDAVDDVTTFEMVHHLVVGNLERAAAVVDGMGPTGGRPPELTGVRTPRDALTIDTRALVLIDASVSSRGRGWLGGTRDRFDPALDAWAAAILPPPNEVGWLATTAKGDTVELRLDALAVSALDACVLASDDPGAITPALRRLAELANPQHTLVAHRPSDSGAAPISLAEFQLLAVEVKRVIQESTPADGSSVAVPGDDSTAAPDAREAIGRAAEVLDDVLATFDAVAGAKDWAALTLDQQADLARLGVVPSPVADPAADFASVRSRVGRREKGANGVEAVDTIAGMRDRVAQITGVAVPLLVPFDLPEPGGVEFSASLATVDEVDDWFDVVASVHPNVGSLWRALQLGGLLTQAAPTLAAGQAPLLPDDSWAGLHRPAPGTGGRVAVAAVTHGNVGAASPVVGLVVDRWSERIPGLDQVTGVAFHFDAPSTEAPQTMLLAVTPEGRSWSADLVLDTVLETIEWMQLRAVAIDDLGDYGHALPTCFTPGRLENSEVIEVAP